MKKAKTTAAAKRDSKERMVSGSSVSNSRKNDSRSKTASASKDLCGNNTIKNKRHHIHRAIKNMRSMHSSERIEEMACELEDY